MKLSAAVLCVLVVAVSARPQRFGFGGGSAQAGGSGFQGPFNNQHLNLFANVQQSNLPTNQGVQSSNNLAISSGTLTSGLGQQTSNLNSQAFSNQQGGNRFRPFGFRG